MWSPGKVLGLLAFLSRTDANYLIQYLHEYIRIRPPLRGRTRRRDPRAVRRDQCLGTHGGDWPATPSAHVQWGRGRRFSWSARQGVAVMGYTHYWRRPL